MRVLSRWQEKRDFQSNLGHERIPCLKTNTKQISWTQQMGSWVFPGLSTFHLRRTERTISSWISFLSPWLPLWFVSQEWASLFAQHRLKQEEHMSSSGGWGLGYWGEGLGVPAGSCPCRSAGHQWEPLGKAGVTGVRGRGSWRLKSSAEQDFLCSPAACGVLEAEVGRILTLTWVSALPELQVRGACWHLPTLKIMLAQVFLCWLFQKRWLWSLRRPKF